MTTYIAVKFSYLRTSIILSIVIGFNIEKSYISGICSNLINLEFSNVFGKRIIFTLPQ
jgi:hypothetical protein